MSASVQTAGNTDLSAAPDATTDEPATPKSMLERSWELENGEDFEAARSAAEAGARIALATNDYDMLLSLRVQQARMAVDPRELTAVLDVYASTLPYLPKCRDKARAVDFLSCYATSLAFCGDFATAMQYIQKARSISQDLDTLTRMRVAMRSCEIRQTVSPSVEAIRDATEALTLFGMLPEDCNTHYRYVYLRKLLVSAHVRLLARTSREAQRGAPLDDLRRLLDEAEARMEGRVPGLSTDLAGVSGFFRRITGGDVGEIRARLMERERDELMLSGTSVHRDFANWAQFEAETGGDLALAARLLDLTAPGPDTDLLNYWRRDWMCARAALYRAEGNLEAACDTYAAQMEYETASRYHYLTVLTDVARRAEHGEELQKRERLAAARAERLKRRNEALAAEKERLSREALTDPLTKLGNRRFLEGEVRRLTADARRTTHSVIVFDIDTFKAINDRFSHLVGDQVIAGLGAVIARTFRPGDICVRYGGEEFVVLVQGRPSFQRMDVVRLAVERHDWTAIDPDLRVTTSIGVAEWEPGAEFETALAKADERLYAAKQRGRNRVVMNDEPDPTSA